MRIIVEKYIRSVRGYTTNFVVQSADKSQKIQTKKALQTFVALVQKFL